MGPASTPNVNTKNAQIAPLCRKARVRGTVPTLWFLPAPAESKIASRDSVNVSFLTLPDLRGGDALCYDEALPIPGFKLRRQFMHYPPSEVSRITSTVYLRKLRRHLKHGHLPCPDISTPQPSFVHLEGYFGYTP